MKKNATDNSPSPKGQPTDFVRSPDNLAPKAVNRSKSADAYSSALFCFSSHDFDFAAPKARRSVLCRLVRAASGNAPALEDWLVDVANARGAGIVTRAGVLETRGAPETSCLSNEEVVVGILLPQNRDPSPDAAPGGVADLAGGGGVPNSAPARSAGAGGSHLRRPGTAGVACRPRARPVATAWPVLRPVKSAALTAPAFHPAGRARAEGWPGQRRTLVPDCMTNA